MSDLYIILFGMCLIGGLIGFPVTAVVALILSASGNPYALKQGVKEMAFFLGAFLIGLIGFKFIL